MDNLPKSVRDIIELVGLHPAMALVREFPGNIIKVPTGSVEDGKMRMRLIGLMGPEAADKFIATYGGERLAIPRCVEAMRDERDRQIIGDYDAGKPVSSLAFQFGLTERQIRTILKRVPGENVSGLHAQITDDKQLGLF